MVVYGTLVRGSVGQGGPRRQQGLLHTHHGAALHPTLSTACYRKHVGETDGIIVLTGYRMQTAACRALRQFVNSLRLEYREFGERIVRGVYNILTLVQRPERVPYSESVLPAAIREEKGLREFLEVRGRQANSVHGEPIAAVPDVLVLQYCGV